MTPSKSRFQCGALTLLEVLVLCAVLAVLIALLMPPRHHESVRRSVCLNNLKNIGLAFRIFESDHSGRFPMQLSTNAGGSLEFVAGGNAFRHFQVMSNELFTPNVLVCPSEKRRAVTNFAVLNNAYLSYFVGLDAVTNLWEMLLAGDRNITNSEPLVGAILLLTTNQTLYQGAGWTKAMHENVGNGLLVDGSMQQLSTARLREHVRVGGSATNRLALP